MVRTLQLWGLVLVVTGCGPEVPEDDGSTGDGDSSGDPVGPDPNHRRDCQVGDFYCENWGCSLVRGECYQSCEAWRGYDDPPPGAVLPGEVSPECDEPERPYCSVIGNSDYGDWDCNLVATVCTAEPLNWCP